MKSKSKKALAMMIVGGGLAAAVAGVTPAVAECNACGSTKVSSCSACGAKKVCGACGACGAKKACGACGACGAKKTN